MPTILVVDDSIMQREMISGYLIQLGCQVAIAIDGVDAVQKANELLPDLVILDIVMPELNGFQVCRQLKTDLPTKHIPVVLCSTKNTEADYYWGLKQGADAYIVKSSVQKDLDQFRKQLVGTVKHLIRQSRA